MTFLFSCKVIKIDSSLKKNDIIWFKLVPKNHDLLFTDEIKFDIVYGKNNNKIITISDSNQNLFRLKKFHFISDKATFKRNKITIQRNKISNLDSQIEICIKDKNNNSLEYNLILNPPTLNKVFLSTYNSFKVQPLTYLSYYAILKYSNNQTHDSRTSIHGKRQLNSDAKVIINAFESPLSNQIKIHHPYPFTEKFCLKLVSLTNVNIKDSLFLKYDFSGNYQKNYNPDARQSTSLFNLLVESLNSFIWNGNSGNHGSHGNNGRNVTVFISKFYTKNDSLLVIKLESNNEKDFFALDLKNGKLNLSANGQNGDNGKSGNNGSNGNDATNSSAPTAGMPGGSGGDGGAGGDGGTFTIITDIESKNYIYNNLSFQNDGGRGGIGGDGGRNGYNGAKIVYDSKTKTNKFEKDYTDRGVAPKGRNGLNGKKGQTENIIVISKEQLKDVFKEYLINFQ